MVIATQVAATQASKGTDGSKDVAPDNVLPAEGEPEVSWRGTRTGVALACLLWTILQYCPCLLYVRGALSKRAVFSEWETSRAGPPPNCVNADGEPVYDPLKDLELATAKVCPLKHGNLGIPNELVKLRGCHYRSCPNAIHPDSAHLLQVAEVAGQAAMKVSTKVRPDGPV